MYVKLESTNIEHLSFLKNNLRAFYNKNILKWQYCTNQKRHSNLYLLKLNNEFCASQGMIPIQLVSENKSRLTVKSESSFLLPKYRGKGLFEDLYSYNIEKSTQDKAELIWGFTPASKVWRKKLKFEVYNGIITETLLQLSANLAFKALFKENLSPKKIIKKSLYIGIKTLSNKKIPKVSKKNYAKEIDLTTKIDMNSIQKVYKNWKNNNLNLINIDLSPEYLIWRLINNPMLKYTVIGLYENEKLYGFGIVNSTTNYSYLVELIVENNENLNKGVYSLLQYWKNVNKSSHINYWASNQNEYSSKIRKILFELGAKQIINNDMNFVVKKTLHNTFNINDIKSFYITGLWTEGYVI